MNTYLCGKPEGVKCLLEALLFGGHVHKHEGLTVTPQGVLKEVGQFGLSVGDVAILSNTESNLS